MNGAASMYGDLVASPRARWEVSPSQRLSRLALVAAGHVIIFAILWRTVIAVAPTIVVPVSLQMISSQAEIIKSPEPLPRKAPKTAQIEPLKVGMVAPEIPLVSNFAMPLIPLEPPAAPPPVAPAKGPDTVPVKPMIQLPLSTADYLSNPAPAYPAASKRLHEQGRVLLYVLVDAQGLPTRIELKLSSGFDRLDEVALSTVQRWKFVPGKRNGVAESMWVEVPIEFRLQT